MPKNTLTHGEFSPWSPSHCLWLWWGNKQGDGPVHHTSGLGTGAAAADRRSIRNELFVAIAPSIYPKGKGNPTFRNQNEVCERARDEHFGIWALPSSFSVKIKEVQRAHSAASARDDDGAGRALPWESSPWELGWPGWAAICCGDSLQPARSQLILCPSCHPPSHLTHGAWHSVSWLQSLQVPVFRGSEQEPGGH